MRSNKPQPALWNARLALAQHLLDAAWPARCGLPEARCRAPGAPACLFPFALPASASLVLVWKVLVCWCCVGSSLFGVLPFAFPIHSLSVLSGGGVDDGIQEYLSKL